jgi:hypothetical protein
MLKSAYPKNSGYNLEFRFVADGRNQFVDTWGVAGSDKEAGPSDSKDTGCLTIKSAKCGLEIGRNGDLQNLCPCHSAGPKVRIPAWVLVTSTGVGLSPFLRSYAASAPYRETIAARDIRLRSRSDRRRATAWRLSCPAAAITAASDGLTLLPARPGSPAAYCHRLGARLPPQTCIGAFDCAHDRPTIAEIRHFQNPSIGPVPMTAIFAFRFAINIRKP